MSELSAFVAGAYDFVDDANQASLLEEAAQAYQAERQALAQLSAEESLRREYRTLRGLAGVRRVLPEKDRLVVQTDALYMETFRPDDDDRVPERPRRLRFVKLPRYDIEIDFRRGKPRVYLTHPARLLTMIPVPLFAFFLIHPHIIIWGEYCIGDWADQLAEGWRVRDVPGIAHLLLLFIETANNDDDVTPLLWWRPWRPHGRVGKRLSRRLITLRNRVLARIAGPLERRREDAYVRWRQTTGMGRETEPSRLLLIFRRQVAYHRWLSRARRSEAESRLLAAGFRANGSRESVVADHPAGPVIFFAKGLITINGQDAILPLAEQNPHLLAALAKLVGQFHFAEALSLVTSARSS